MYLSHVQLFQRHVTTAAFKLAGGVDLSAPNSGASAARAAKQYPVPQEFVARIVKAFVDSLYAFLDGLVHLASDEGPPPVRTGRAHADIGAVGGTNRLELLNLADMVSTPTGESGLLCREELIDVW